MHGSVDTTWLGHVETTQIDLHADLALKEWALARTAPRRHSTQALQTTRGVLRLASTRLIYAGVDPANQLATNDIGLHIGVAKVGIVRSMPTSHSTQRGFPLTYSWLLAGRGFRGSGDARPQHLVVTRFQEYQDGNPLSTQFMRRLLAMVARAGRWWPPRSAASLSNSSAPRLGVQVESIALMLEAQLPAVATTSWSAWEEITGPGGVSGS